MRQRRRRRLIALLIILAVVLLNFPALAIVDHLRSMFGPVMLPAYIFAAWALLIAGMARLMLVQRDG